MAVSDLFQGVYSIPGRGTVATGRVEQGAVKVGDDVDILGLGKTLKSTVTGYVSIISQ